MQELRSTDILEKEIQTDARKKAEEILKQAESECKNILESVDADLEKAKTEKQIFFSRKLEAFEKDQKASIPLEEQRFAVSFIQSSISKQINAYLASLTENERMEIAAKGYDFSLSKKMNAYVYGFNKTEAEKFLAKKMGKNLLNCTQTIFRKTVLEDDYGLDNPEGIILEAEDKSFRARLTLSEVISHLLDKNRAELSDALFGGSL